MRREERVGSKEREEENEKGKTQKRKCCERELYRDDLSEVKRDI